MASTVHVSHHGMDDFLSEMPSKNGISPLFALHPFKRGELALTFEGKKRSVLHLWDVVQMPPPKKNNHNFCCREFGIFACHVQLLTLGFPSGLRSVPRFLPRNHHRTPWRNRLLEEVVPQGAGRYSGDWPTPFERLVSFGADIVIWLRCFVGWKLKVKISNH